MLIHRHRKHRNASSEDSSLTRVNQRPWLVVCHMDSGSWAPHPPQRAPLSQHTVGSANPVWVIVSVHRPDNLESRTKAAVNKRRAHKTSLTKTQQATCSPQAGWAWSGGSEATGRTAQELASSRSSPEGSAPLPPFFTEPELVPRPPFTEGTSCAPC